MNKESKYLLLITCMLSLIGIIMIYSASNIWANYKYNDSFHFVKLQLIYLIISFSMMFITAKIDYNYWKKKSNLILLLCFILLIIVLIPGIGTLKNGSRSWRYFGIVSMQPSEFAKMGLIIFLSKYLSNNQGNMKYIDKGVIPILIVLFWTLL